MVHMKRGCQGLGQRVGTTAVSSLVAVVAVVGSMVFTAVWAAEPSSEVSREAILEAVYLYQFDHNCTALEGHPKASLAYAWAHETDMGTRRYVAVLNRSSRCGKA